MPPDPRVLLADVDRAGAEIERFMEGIGTDAFASSRRARAELLVKDVPRQIEPLDDVLQHAWRDGRLASVKWLSAGTLTSVLIGPHQ